MAEIELGVLDRQCLDRRIGALEILEQETQAWQDQRNREAGGLAFHHPGRPHQTKVPIPINPTLTDY